MEDTTKDQDIWAVVREIRDSPYRSLPTFQENIRKSREWFFTKYPTLAEMCLTSEKFDENALQFMLRQKAQVEASAHTQHDASVIVGEHLARTYIPMYKK